VEPGIVSSTLGTSGVVFAYLDEPLMDEQLRTHTFCHAVEGKWHTMGVMLAAGGSFRWVRDTLCTDLVEKGAATGTDPYEFMTREAGKLVTSEGLIFLPYLTGERTPYPDPHAKGVFFGLSLRHTRAHLLRAVMEGVAFGMRDCFQVIKDMGVSFRQVRASGGGARSSVWRQINADVTGEAHATINVDEGPAYGAALLAAVGSGHFASVPEACRQTLEVLEETAPNPEAVERYTAYHAVYQDLYAHLRGDFAHVQELVDQEA
jgi:xylulokinase